MALVKDDGPKIGFVYNPVANNLYSAYDSGGAYANDVPIHISTGKDMKKEQIVWDYINLSGKLGKSELNKLDYSKLHSNIMDELIKLHGGFYRVRNLGTSAFSLAWVATGMFGVYYSPLIHKKKMVDFAAGMIIAKEAGAKVVLTEVCKSTFRLVVGTESCVDYLESLQ